MQTDAATTWAAVRPGDSLPTIKLDVTLSRVMITPAATRDYFPGHHLVSYAQQEQSQPTIYLNTMSLHGFVDRVALEWAGEEWFIACRKMTMVRSAYAERILAGTGSVLEKSRSDDGTLFILVAVTATSGEDIAVAAEILLSNSATFSPDTYAHAS